MTRSEWKAAARARLGGGIFKDQWLMGVVFCLVVSAIVGAAGSILPGVGARRHRPDALRAEICLPCAGARGPRH